MQLSDDYINEKTKNILDVRKPGEWTGEHIDGAQHFALDFINNQNTNKLHDNNIYKECDLTIENFNVGASVRGKK